MKVKVSSGRSNNVTKNLNCDSSSTYLFGEVQPILCMELEPNSSVKAYLRTIARVGVLNVPTFGRMQYEVRSRFVPIADIYRPFENLLSGQTFSTGDNSYIPTSVPRISIGILTSYLLSPTYSDCTLYTMNPDHDNEFVLSRFSSTSGIIPTASAVDLFDLLPYSYFDQSSEGSDLTFVKSLFKRNNNEFSQYLPTEYRPTPDISSNVTTQQLSKLQVTPDSADFMFSVKDVSSEADPNLGTVLVCYRLNNLGRSLRKVLIGCGWQPDLASKDLISILPFVAFYKAYFDELYPQVTSSGLPYTFDQTSCHALMEQIIHYDYNLINVYDAANDVFPLKSLFAAFLLEISSCSFYDETDFVTSHISKPSYVPGSSTIDQNRSFIPNASSPDDLASGTSYQAVRNNTSGLPYLDTNRTPNVTAWSVRLLLKLLPYFNKSTIVGGNIKEWLKAHGYGDFIQDSQSFSAGKYELPLRISDIDSVADTYNEETQEGDLLGSYTGKGLGFTPDENPANFEYETTTNGFFILFAYVRPFARVSQGVNPLLFHRNRLEFFNPAFDSLDYQVSRKSLVCGSRELYDSTVDSEYIGEIDVKDSPASSSFGFIPRYAEYCYLPNILNGSLSLRSTRSTFIPYTLDKYYENNSEFIESIDSSGSYFVDISTGYVVPVANPGLRNINSPLNGNFARIFANAPLAGGVAHRTQVLDAWKYIDDQFVIHNQIDIEYSSAKKPLKESFETNDGGHEFEVDKE